MKTEIVSVDFQREFASEEGKWFSPSESINFVKNVLVPFCKEQNIKISEIISDYRQPRPGDSGDGCYPGSNGYISEIPNDIKKSVWIKCMNSPIWIRDNIGDPNKKPGLPYPDPNKFTNWLKESIGKPDECEVVLVGLTIDCCVLCAAQELTFRGYNVFILREAVDTASRKPEETKFILSNPPLLNWAEVISWENFKSKF